MSRAFVREPDGEDVVDDLPELPQEPVPNYVTPEGMEMLEGRLSRLRAERDALESEQESMVGQNQLAHVRRDLRYVEGRIDHAVVVDPVGQSPDEVAFGARVDVRDENGHAQTWRIVGENQADIGKGLVSWVSPLARALYGAEVGDVVTWQRPAGDLELEVTAISYG